VGRENLKGGKEQGNSADDYDYGEGKNMRMWRMEERI
jgi:hypothetical protein